MCYLRTIDLKLVTTQVCSINEQLMRGQSSKASASRAPSNNCIWRIKISYRTDTVWSYAKGAAKFVSAFDLILSICPACDLEVTKIMEVPCCIYILSCNSFLLVKLDTQI